MTSYEQSLPSIARSMAERMFAERAKTLREAGFEDLGRLFDDLGIAMAAMRAGDFETRDGGES